MKTTAIFSFLLILLCLQSCAQKNETKTNLKPKSIYEVTKDNINETVEKYGLKGKVKIVEQKTYSAPKDSITDFSKYEPIDMNDEHEYFNLAEMDNDCKVTFNENGNIVNRISFGRRFGSKSVETDTLFYDNKNQLIIIRNNLEGDDFAFPGDMKFEYNKSGHLIKQYVNKQIWLHTYFEDKNQVRIVHHEDNEFRFDNIYTYNKFGQEIEKIGYKQDGSIENRWVFEYDDKGEIKKEILYNPDGTNHEYYKHKYDSNIKEYQQLDKNKNCTTRIIIDQNGKVTIRTRKFEYYK